MFTLAHLSDVHLSPLPRVKRTDLLSKRLLGYVNWHRGRKFVHRREYLNLLTRDLAERDPDHIAVTGDLINLGLPKEYLRAADWLHHLGNPNDVTAIPGNHDAYVRMHPDTSTRHWQPYMTSNEAGEALFTTPTGGFPFVRCFGDIGIVALSSAIPTMPFIAAGRLGKAQLADLANALDAMGREGLFRTVLIHHPPLPGQAGWRRGLRDADALRDVLEAHGADLVLHGHNHAQTVHELQAASGPTIVVGVPSASDAVDGRTPAARYNEYNIERAGNGWRVEMIGRAAADLDQVWECERRVLRER
ncbi:MAG: metallophosphoesterase family protein [Methyloceanibacter sp.]|uniref:metallophosphoesterase family protein n=1 Tax=Methyloceanibacter sp. TaxID=1965321 RepID=UPI0035630DC9